MGWKKGFPGVFIDFRPPGDLALDHFFGDSAPKLIPLFVKKTWQVARAFGSTTPGAWDWGDGHRKFSREKNNKGIVKETRNMW